MRRRQRNAFVGLAFGARFAPKLSPQVVVLLGLSIFAIANHLLTLQLTPDTPALNLYLILFLHGASLGMQVPAVSGMLLGKFFQTPATLPDSIWRSYYHLRGVGSVLGVSVAAAMLDIRESVHSSRLLDVAGRLNPDVHRLVTELGHRLATQKDCLRLPPSLVPIRYSRGWWPGRHWTLCYIIDIFWCFQMLALA